MYFTLAACERAKHCRQAGRRAIERIFFCSKQPHKLSKIYPPNLIFYSFLLKSGPTLQKDDTPLPQLNSNPEEQGRFRHFIEKLNQSMIDRLKKA